MLLSICLLVVTYVWLYDAFTVASLALNGLLNKLADMYYICVITDLACISFFLIKNKKINSGNVILFKFHIIFCFLVLIALGMRWIDYEGDQSGQIFIFDPILRSVAFLLIVILLFAKGLERPPQKLDRE